MAALPTKGIRRRTVLSAAPLGAAQVWAAQSAAPVDLQLVLAVDVSRSIDEEEARLQRDGYRAAMASPGVLGAIEGGEARAIAVAYVEWAAFTYQRLVLPWTRIATREDAAAWAGQLARSPRQSVSWTSLSGALAFSRRTLADCPFPGARRVIDVSGDGANNHGPPAEGERDRLVQEGVVINGLPILNDRPNFAAPPAGGLEAYYRDAVAGGDGSFVIAAEDFQAFGDAIRRKLIQEIA